MKLYIPKVINIEVNYIDMNSFYAEDIPLAANESNDELLNWDRVRSKFMDFVRDILGLTVAYKFDVKEHHKSNRGDPNSYYISFYPKTEDYKILGKYLLNFRLSDHDVEDLDLKSFDHYANLAQKYKLTDERIQAFRFYNIVIDGKQFNSYTEAYEHIRQMFDGFSSGNYDI